MYRLPLDGVGDKDIIEWIDSIPRSKKAEVIRHAIRFYQAHLGESDTFFVMPSAQNSRGENDTKSVKTKPAVKKKPIIGLGDKIKNAEDK